MHNDFDTRKLIDGCRRNDRSAQRALYDKYAPMMYPVCLRYIANEAEAEDVLIEAFLTVFTHIGDLEKASSLQSWIYSIVVNGSLQFLRKRQKQPHTEPFENLTEVYPAEEAEDPSTQWQAQDVMQVIAEMPETWRVIFNMHAIDDFTFREIAEKVGMNQNTVRVYYQRARAWTLEQLEKKERNRK